jgi:tetratricopeptide (TPR) repeat protein
MVIRFPTERTLNRPAYTGPNLPLSECFEGNPRARAIALYAIGCRLDEASPEAAIPLYQRALRITPGMGVARVNLGNCHYRLGHREEAREQFLHALMIEPSCHEAAFNLGVLAQEDEDFEGACLLYRQCLQYDDFADAHCNLAICLYALGQNETGHVHYERYKQLIRRTA